MKELEKLKLKFLEEEKKNKQLTQDLNAAVSQVQNLKVINQIISLVNDFTFFKFLKFVSL